MRSSVFAVRLVRAKPVVDRRDAQSRVIGGDTALYKAGFSAGLTAA